MLKQILGATLCTVICSAAAFADAPATDSTATTSASLSITGPQEVGTTSMPPGNYLIKEQTTGNSFSLMVSNKGTMILAPAPAPGATAAAPAAAGAAPASTQSALTGLGTSAVKRMVQDQMTKGITNVIEKDATSSFGKFMK